MKKSPFTILIVEDDSTIRKSLQEILQMEGYKVISAINGAEGLKALAKDPKPNLIILDLMMPVMSGPQFLEVKKNTPEYSNIPVLVFSAVSSKKIPEGAVDAIKKPIEVEALLKTVQKFLPEQPS